MLKKSVFCISEPVRNGVLMKNTFTGSVIFLSFEREYELIKWLENQHILTIPLFSDDMVVNGFLVDADLNEFQNWRKLLFETRIIKRTFLHCILNRHCSVNSFALIVLNMVLIGRYP